MAFIILYAMKYSLKDVHIISRTTTGQWYSFHRKLARVEHWVVQFVRGLALERFGFDINNMKITKHNTGPFGKGKAASRMNLTHFIDNDMLNLGAWPTTRAAIAPTPWWACCTTQAPVRRAATTTGMSEPAPC